MQLSASLVSSQDILPLRMRQREELNCQIVHDSIHQREGWTRSYRIEQAGAVVGFGSIAIAGPWQDKPTVFEFYVLPEFRTGACELFEVFIAASGARFLELQTSDRLSLVLAHVYGRDVVSEKIVFRDQVTTTLPANGATLGQVTPDVEILAHQQQRRGGGEWVLEVDGQAAGKGGILFHYNPPYGDIYMDVAEPFRRRGLGAYLVQELKRRCYELGGIPAARCSPANIASRRTLQRAGFVPSGHILIGTLPVE